MEIDKKLIEYIDSNVFPSYEKNEWGHGIDHIKEVIRRSIKFADTVENIDYNMVYTIAAYHDIGHYINPKLHEKISADMLYADKNLKNIEAFGEHDCKVQLKLDEILYFEADAEQVFAYTADEIYQMKLRLYQVESISKTAGIIRASKSYLVNLNKIQSVRTALNSRLYAKMPNGEEVLFSRKYAPVLKEAMLS